VVVGEDNADRRPLVVEIAHMGDETFEDSNRTKFHFAHDMVNIQFSYDTTRAQVLEKFNSMVVFTKQGIESDWSSGGDEKPTASTFAAIGPFTEWRFMIKEAENPGPGYVKGHQCLYRIYRSRSIILDRFQVRFSLFQKEYVQNNFSFMRSKVWSNENVMTIRAKVKRIEDPWRKKAKKGTSRCLNKLERLDRDPLDHGHSRIYRSVGD